MAELPNERQRGVEEGWKPRGEGTTSTTPHFPARPQHSTGNSSLEPEWRRRKAEGGRGGGVVGGTIDRLCPRVKAQFGEVEARLEVEEEEVAGVFICSHSFC